MKVTYTRRDIALILVSAALTAASIYVAMHSNESTVGAWLFGGGTLVLVAAPYLRAKQQRGAAALRNNERVEFDDESIRRIMRDDRIESIRWIDLAEVGILTTDEGPWSEDLYWMLYNYDKLKGCAVQNDADGFKELLQKLQSLPGFDNRQVIEAMGSTSNRRFLVWKSDAQPHVPRDAPISGASLN